MVRLRLINILHHCRSEIYKVGVAASRGAQLYSIHVKKSVESSGSAYFPGGRGRSADPKITGTSIRLPHKHDKELRHQAQLLVVYKV